MSPLTGDGPVADQEDEPPSAEVRPTDERPAPRVVVADARTDDGTPVDLAALADLLGRVLAQEGAPPRAEASLRLVDASEIAALKVEYLDGDGDPTDVLSFPVDGTEPDAELVGDVVLCPAVAAAQAREHAGTLEDELALLVVHSGLHLAGWDHEDSAERTRMWARERTLLADLHRLPLRDPWKETP